MPSNASAEVGAIRYEIVHTTNYDYRDSVLVSQHVAHLTPRTLPRQTCVSHELHIEPTADLTANHTDYFGNTTTFFAMQSAHKHLSVRARSRVALGKRPELEPSSTVRWEQAADRSALPLDALESAFAAPLGRTSADLAGYARPSFPAGRPLVEAVADLTGRIHADFTFDTKATTITTSLAQVFESRRGVCQDFARFEIACLRVLGLGARYVSGYLETKPPPGKPRLLGADASHAWLAFYCPGIGWVDVDPTNNLFPSDTHVTLAWGLDYSDVSPIRGVILGGGQHTLKVSVDVLRL